MKSLRKLSSVDVINRNTLPGEEEGAADESTDADRVIASSRSVVPKSGNSAIKQLMVERQSISSDESSAQILAEAPHY